MLLTGAWPCGVNMRSKSFAWETILLLSIRLRLIPRGDFSSRGFPNQKGVQREPKCVMYSPCCLVSHGFSVCLVIGFLSVYSSDFCLSDHRIFVCLVSSFRCNGLATLALAGPSGPRAGASRPLRALRARRAGASECAWMRNLLTC